jgi:hypothetical protein
MPRYTPVHDPVVTDGVTPMRTELATVVSMATAAGAL